MSCSTSVRIKLHAAGGDPALCFSSALPPGLPLEAFTRLPEFFALLKIEMLSQSSGVSKHRYQDSRFARTARDPSCTERQLAKTQSIDKAEAERRNGQQMQMYSLLASKTNSETCISDCPHVALETTRCQEETLWAKLSSQFVKGTSREAIAKYLCEKYGPE